MDIIFYNNLSDPNTINKALTEVLTLSGELKSSCDIISPNITISNHGMINANYCYIPEFGRYYFIVKQTIITNNVIEIKLNVDVLESFKLEILSLQCILENSTTNNDNYLSGHVDGVNIHIADSDGNTIIEQQYTDQEYSDLLDQEEEENREYWLNYDGVSWFEQVRTWFVLIVCDAFRNCIHFCISCTPCQIFFKFS